MLEEVESELLEEVDTTDAEWKYADLAYGLLIPGRGLAQSYGERLELMHHMRNGNKIRYKMQLFSDPILRYLKTSEGALSPYCHTCCCNDTERWLGGVEP